MSLSTPQTQTAASAWDPQVCEDLIRQLWPLRQAMLEREAASAELLDALSPAFRDSARNLLHFLVLRSVDLRPLQDKLAWLGLSSLGRSESHVMANLDKVLGLLHRLTGQDWQDRSSEEAGGSVSSRERLRRNAVQLLGEGARERSARIMVTLPTEAALDFGVVQALVEAGMDIARINCAHDSADEWRAMAIHVYRAAKLAGRKVKILMDLAGPKIRTGELADRPSVLKLKPRRDEFGTVVEAAHLGLRAISSQEPVRGADACVGVWESWLARLKVGMQIELLDARGAKRHMRVVEKHASYALAQCLRTVYLTPETVLTQDSSGGRKKYSTLVCQIPSLPGEVHLARGDMLYLRRAGTVRDLDVPQDAAQTEHDEVWVACTLPQVFDQVHAGERIWFDDGRIGGVIREVSAQRVDVEITQARAGGAKLAGDKGINLPDSQLDLPALTAKDIEDLAVVAEQADMVGLSFVQRPQDVALLHEHLKRLNREDMGVVLKIETRQGFENLPQLMLAAMAMNRAGIMIARGDLAVECGYERLAEVQEEILWCAEAAHMPVIWATQVLESLVKTGLPSRAEVSDAGLGVRAECVMLNKGPYMLDAMQVLDDILQRMSGHQDKKRPLLRALKAWR